MMRIMRKTIVLLALILSAPSYCSAQSFDFDRMLSEASSYLVVVDIKMEVSFGMQMSEQRERLLGTIVSKDGLVLFNASVLANDNMLSSLSGMSVSIEPTRIEIATLDGESFDAEYIGYDRFTEIGFAQVLPAEGRVFEPVKFATDVSYEVGDWLALFMLLPDFVDPPLAADIGMISSLVEMPEEFTLTVGFSSVEMTSVLFDSKLRPVGVLGAMMDPSSATTDASGMLEGFGQFGIPLLGVITGERLQKLIADPPREGEMERGWLGISLQALTEDIGNFLGIDASGGIIVNDLAPGGPAELGGIAVGDVVAGINGQDIEVDKDENIAVFQRMIAELGPGARVEFLVYRPQDESLDTLSILVTLANAPLAASQAEDYESKELEFKLRNLVFSDFLRYNLDSTTFKGVVVSEIKQGGLANVGGLRVGDVIQRIENLAITKVEEARTAIENLQIEKPSEIIVFVWRNNKTMFVNIKTDWQ